MIVINIIITIIAIVMITIRKGEVGGWSINAKKTRTKINDHANKNESKSKINHMKNKSTTKTRPAKRNLIEPKQKRV